MIVRKRLLREKRNHITPEHSRIGQILSIRFEELDINYRIFERKTGIGMSKLRRILNGSQDWTLYDMIQVTNALGIEMKDLWK